MSGRGRRGGRRQRRRSEEWLVHIVCTDDGRHEQARLTQLSWWPGGVMADGEFAEPHLMERGGRAIRPDAQGRPRRTTVPSATRYPAGPVGRRVLNFDCPRCDRHVPWRWDTASTYAEEAYEQGVSRIDVSRLDH